VRTIVWQNEAEDGSDPALVARGATMDLACSVMDTLGVSGAITSTEDVIALDPRFCDPVPPMESPTTSGDYGIDANSPCSAENAPCGRRIGARDPGCVAPLRFPGSAGL
jgi:hypothetical protein